VKFYGFPWPEKRVRRNTLDLNTYCTFHTKQRRSATCENVPRTENALGTWPAELKVDLKRSQTGPQHDIRMCFVAYWTQICPQYDLTLIRDLSGSHVRTLARTQYAF